MNRSWVIRGPHYGRFFSGEILLANFSRNGYLSKIAKRYISSIPCSGIPVGPSNRFATTSRWLLCNGTAFPNNMHLLCSMILFAVACSMTCHADMGSIPFKRKARIVEPNQDAIIAWNGKEQLLYLQTTLGASEETKVLEVMPLPSKPMVDEADPRVFTRCKSLLPRVVVRGAGDADPFGPFSASGATPAARVVERKMIGAHDLRTVELLDAERFSAWVSAEFGAANQGLEVPAPLLAVIGEYAREGYKCFLFLEWNAVER